MKKTVRIILIALMLLGTVGCSNKEASVIATYEVTDADLAEEYWNTNQLITMVKYYEMSDGTWKTDHHTYQYRLEITGRMGTADKDSTFVFLTSCCKNSPILYQVVR